MKQYYRYYITPDGIIPCGKVTFTTDVANAINSKEPINGKSFVLTEKEMELPERDKVQ